MANVEAQPLRAGLDAPDKDPHKLRLRGCQEEAGRGCGVIQDPWIQIPSKEGGSK